MVKKSKTLCVILWMALFSQMTPSYAQIEMNRPFVPCDIMPDLITHYYADFSSLTRAYFVDGSPERSERLDKLYNSYLSKLNALDFNALPQECQVDYILIKRDLTENLRLSALERKENSQMTKWFPFADQIYSYEHSRRSGDIPDSKSMALAMEAAAKQIEDLKGSLETDDEVMVGDIYAANDIINGLKKALESVYSFYNGYDPMFTWWVPLPYEKLVAALTKYGQAFSSKLEDEKFKQDDSGIVGKSVGNEELINLLKYNFIPYTPEELITIANKEFEWCDKELLKATQDMGFGNDWKAAMEKVKETYVLPGEQPKDILRLFDESIKFIEDHDLLTIDPLAKEVWGLRMMSPERQLVNPFFTGGTSISISYPTNTMDIDDRMMSMRGNNPHFSRATVHHESIGGHHYQRFMNDRYRAYRNFRTPFWHEGNALYWEFILYDMGFPQSPEDKIGMLFWRMHRCARVIFSLNYHLGKWTPQQCIDFLVDRVGHERANAEGEVRRSFTTRVGPLYQLAYMMGGLQFYALKKELVDSGKMTYKEYHDAILAINAMPVEMVRAILSEKKLNKNFKTNWKFYD